jgi:hypothetical protein
MATLKDVAAALAAIPEHELRALWATVEGSPIVTPGLTAWLEGAIDWELHRRIGFLHHLFGPHAAIDDSEAEGSLAALAALAGRYRQAGHRNAGIVADFLELAAALLREEVDRTDWRRIQ